MPQDTSPLPDHDERLRTARAVAAYELGDPSWADLIVAAYLDPATAADNLRLQRGDDE